ncbi:MAG: sterol desaturase family protein [Acidobacteriota bacterium]|nr:sterol desaturase family protein [Acidobacteriota bacterium]
MAIQIIAFAALTLAVAVLMEGVAWALHRYGMHGALWFLHEDHHRPKKKGFQKNDLFAVFFSAAAVSIFLLGRITGLWVITSVAIGVMLYGLGDFLFHDVMFHKRIPGFRIPARTPYLRRIINAHKVHHQNSGKSRGISFGFLYAPPHYNTPEVESAGG